MRSYRYRSSSGKVLMAMFWASVVVMVVSSWFLINAGPENSRVDFFSGRAWEGMMLEGHELLHNSPLNPPFDFALADSVLTVDIQFLEEHQLTAGPVSALGRHGDFSTYYQELVELRDKVNELAVTYPDSASGNNAGNEEFREVAQPVISSIIHFDSSFLLAHAMQGSLRSWSIAFMASMLLFVYGLICWKQSRFN